MTRIKLQGLHAHVKYSIVHATLIAHRSIDRPVSIQQAVALWLPVSVAIS